MRGFSWKIFCQLPVSVTVTSQAMGRRVTQTYRVRPILRRMVVATTSATEARIWFAMPKSGQRELMPPSGSRTPW